MFVLFDNGTPRTLARYLIDRHSVTEARARGWQELENGELLAEAEAAGFEVLVTTDKNLRYQQNLSGRKIAVVVLGQARWKLIEAHVGRVVQAVNDVAGKFLRGADPVYEEDDKLTNPCLMYATWSLPAIS